MNELKTTIGLEIHVQLKTKSKMFCRCDNNAEGKAPNTVVCPVCLGLPGALPVANEDAVLMTIKTGLAINSEIPKIAKFDRKHYFYPDLPKGYQISQYDEPFAVGGYIEIETSSSQPSASNDKDKNIVRALPTGRQAERELSKTKIRFNRVHLEEDAGKLIHSNGNSLVDLNRAGTPLMEMVTEPDITSPKQAGDFLRRLQKLVRDEVRVSDADMEKGHMRCDANISVCEIEQSHFAKASRDGQVIPARMSEIVEIKNINSFRFVEKALALEEARLKAEYPNWPEKKGKVTRGYDSKKNITYVQRTKEEAADYRYFPEPDLPPFDTTKFDIDALRREIGESLEAKISGLVSLGVSESEAKIIVSDPERTKLYSGIAEFVDQKDRPLLARVVAQNYFPFTATNEAKYPEYSNGINSLAKGEISKAQFAEIARLIHEESGKTFEAALEATGGGRVGNENEISAIIDRILLEHQNEVGAYKAGKTPLFGFFVGAVMRETKGKADPKVVNEVLRKKLS